MTHGGSSFLIDACSNEDADPDVVKLLLLKNDDLKYHKNNDVNYKIRAKTLKWKLIRLIARTSLKVFNKSSGLLKSIAVDSGSTALHYAAMRGDMEIVEILLSKGADPSLKNDLGQDAAGMCKSFPELRGVLEKRERKMRLHGSKVKTLEAVEILGKRISTATPIQHEMWLISLENLLMLYGGEKGNRRVMDVHQELKRRDLLTPWRDAPADCEIIFVSAHSTL